MDPPWSYGDRLPGPGRGAAKYYETLSTREILAMPGLVDFNLASDAHVYVWTTNSFVQEAYELLAAFDAVHKTNITWVKVKKGRHPEVEAEDADGEVLDDSDLTMGMGHSWRGVTEHCLFGIKGRLPAQVHNLHNVIVAERGVHSEKPRVFYERVEQLSPGPYLELFARGGRPGWTSWGNEADT